MFYCVDCKEMSFSERKTVQVIYRRIKTKKKRAPKTVEMRKALSFSKVKIAALTACIAGGGMVIPLIWFSLIGIPFLIKSENEKWERLFPDEKSNDEVLLTNS